MSFVSPAVEVSYTTLLEFLDSIRLPVRKTSVPARSTSTVPVPVRRAANCTATRTPATAAGRPISAAEPTNDHAVSVFAAGDKSPAAAAA